MPATLPARAGARRARRARTLAALTIVAALACSGGDAPTRPVDPGPTTPTPPTPTANPLVVASDTVRANELITLRPSGLGATVPDTITGLIGTTPLRAARADDSTLVAIVPAGVSGTQTVRFVIGTRPFTTQVVLGAAPPSAASPAATAGALFDAVTARLDTLQAALVADAGGDTVVVAQLMAAGRASIAQARQNFLSLSAAEQAAAIPFIVAEAAAQGVYVSGATTSRVRDAGPAPLAQVARPNAAIRPLCSLVTSFDACSAAATTRSAITGGIATLGRCALDVGQGAVIGGVFGGVIGGAIGFLAGGIGTGPGMAAGVNHGAHIGAGIALAMCLTDAAERVRLALNDPVTPVLQEATPIAVAALASTGGPRANASRVAASSSLAAATGPNVYTVGVARQVDVYVEFRSLSAADAAGPPAAAELVTLFNQLAARWDSFRARVPVVQLPALTLPASPRRVVRRKVPGTHLGVVSAAPSPIAGSSAGSEAWTVTFVNPGQGDDHDFSYKVRFTFPGFPDQERTLTGTLQPSRYTVAALTVTPASDTIMVGRQATLAWTARDSSGDLLSEVQLAGRRPTWTTASATVATVGATTGVVTGAGAGTTTVTAALETGRGTASVRVVPDIAGTYRLQSIGGVAVPGTTYADTIYVIRTTSGSVTLREDGTFSYSISATGTNTRTNVNYDEGGAGGGTYRIGESGASFTFETTAQEGAQISFGAGSVNGSTLTLSVITPEGGSSAILIKQ